MPSADIPAKLTTWALMLPKAYVRTTVNTARLRTKNALMLLPRTIIMA
jgi:hypothetical protein